jgi:hypothetical protein
MDYFDTDKYVVVLENACKEHNGSVVIYLLYCHCGSLPELVNLGAQTQGLLQAVGSFLSLHEFFTIIQMAMKCRPHDVLAVPRAVQGIFDCVAEFSKQSFYWQLASTPSVSFLVSNVAISLVDIITQGIYLIIQKSSHRLPTDFPQTFPSSLTST